MFTYQERQAKEQMKKILRLSVSNINKCGYYVEKYACLKGASVQTMKMNKNVVCNTWTGRVSIFIQFFKQTSGKNSKFYIALLISKYFCNFVLNPQIQK